MRHTTALIVARAASACCALGCSFGPVHGYEPDLGTEFSDTDLAVIRRELGNLPDTPPADPTNAFADDRDAAVFGQMLFFDPRYSQNGDIACATCHDPTTGFQDARANTSHGLAFTNRHTPTLLNIAYGAARPGSTVWQYWDGRKDSVWSQALGPPENGNEMGGSRVKIALLIYDKYHDAYRSLFGDMPALRDASGNPVVSDQDAAPAMPGVPETAHNLAWDALSDTLKDQITEVYVNFGKAIAAYERLLVSKDSRFDQFYEEIAAGATRSKALDDQEAAGLKVFIGDGKCISCHIGPNFTDWKFHNIGVEQTGPNIPYVDTGRESGLPLVVTDPFNCAGKYSDRADKGGCAVSSIMVDANAALPYAGAFKTPGLRSVSQTAPYFHTGEEQTLDDVVDHYDEGGDGGGFSGNVDPNVTPLDLTEEQKAALVAFLRSLDGAPLPSSLTTAPPLPQ